MSKPIIEISNLSKKYRIGVRQPYYSLRDTLMGLFNDPLYFLKRRKIIADGLTNDQFWALKNVTFNVQPGEVVGIIGRNGAGKTTLLKLLSQITPPTTGKIILRGRVASLLEVGTGFHPELTGRENIYLNGVILGMKQKEIKKKFDEIIDFADIGKFLDTPVKHYSSGMYMRLAFAVAAHLMTEILIVDEVLAVGDTDFQKKCLGKIHSLAGQGRTVLFVSHNMFSITRLCTRVLLLNNGLIDKDGKPVQITSYYLNNLEKLSGFKSNKKIKYDETKEMQLINVRLVIDSDVKTIIDVRDKFELVIEYRVNKPGLKCRCAASFFTQGFCVFTSVEPYELERVKNGCYSSTLTIPSNLLTEGDYVIGISINTSKGGLYHFIKAKDILSFRVVDSKGGTSARGDFTYNLVGVIRPLLDWRTKYINN